MRIISITIGTCGIAVYLFNIIIRYSVSEDMNIATWIISEQALFITKSIMVSGLAPLILSTYFLLINKSSKANLRGIIYVILFIPIHIYVTAFSAHSPMKHALIPQSIEVLLAITLIALWKKNHNSYIK